MHCELVVPFRQVVQLELVVLLRQVVQLELVVPVQLVVLQLVVLQSTTSTKITTTNWSSVSLLAVWQRTARFSILAGVLCQRASTT